MNPTIKCDTVETPNICFLIKRNHTKSFALLVENLKKDQWGNNVTNFKQVQTK